MSGTYILYLFRRELIVTKDAENAARSLLAMKITTAIIIANNFNTELEVYTYQVSYNTVARKNKAIQSQFQKYRWGEG